MSSFRESMSSGDPKSRKTKGDEALFSSGASKPIGQSSVSSCITIGDPNSKEAKSEAAVSSSGSTKPIGKTDVSSGLSIDDHKSRKPNGLIIHTEKIGFSSGVRGKAAFSSGDRGKAIVSDSVGEVMSFREVTFGPHENEMRFRLIHFWEARNSQTKMLTGLEMLFIDKEV